MDKMYFIINKKHLNRKQTIHNIAAISNALSFYS